LGGRAVVSIFRLSINPTIVTREASIEARIFLFARKCSSSKDWDIGCAVMREGELGLIVAGEYIGSVTITGDVGFIIHSMMFLLLLVPVGD
jgi:hypothetical protein